MFLGVGLLINSTALLSQVDLPELNDLYELKSERAQQNSDSVQKRSASTLNLADFEEMDDLRALREDIGDNQFKTNGSLNINPPMPNSDSSEVENVVVNEPANVERARVRPQIKEPVIFDVGEAERELLNISRYIETQIPPSEWRELVSDAQVTEYTVQEGDWLWRISHRFFGSGFYYPKIWSLNPKIKNPHEIEPGMILIFDTGTIDDMPSVSLGDFSADEEKADTSIQFASNLDQFGDSVIPNWLIERERLKNEGAYFQYASAYTYADLELLSQRYLEDEYERYEPPQANIVIQEPGDQYDEMGFDRDSVVEFNYRDGFYLTTFVTNNIIQDLGSVNAIQGERVFIQQFDTVYVQIDSGVQVKPGDRFSVYSPQGRISHPISDRQGYRYTIVAQVEVIRQIDSVWEAQITELSGLVQRGDRLTVFTPGLDRIVQTFSRRNIEAAIIGAYEDTSGGISLGDVVYLDRGRVDGVELGNIFELYGFRDRGTGRRITNQPTYKVGEVVVLNVTDNFSTALVINSSVEISVGTLAITKTADEVAREARMRDRQVLDDVRQMERDALDDLDIEVNLDNLAIDLLKRADEIRMTDDEFDELERQERERSIIDDHERDLRELERLEREISEAEAALGESRLDEDRFLEQQSLEELEREVLSPARDAFESLDDIEREHGLLFMDEDLNARENPFGLTEFDLEEIHMLLNTSEE